MALPKCECGKPITLCDRLNCSQSTFIHNPPPMTPDKLPEEITEDILLSAKAFAAGMWSGISKHDANQRIYVASVWEAGATVWAPWKVRYDELQAQAQRMADALEKCVQFKNGCYAGVYLNVLFNECEQALQQFRDGKGKEVRNG